MFDDIGEEEIQGHVLLALKKSGDVSVYASEQIKQKFQSVMLRWARSHLRRAYESTMNEFLLDDFPMSTSMSTRFPSMSYASSYLH